MSEIKMRTRMLPSMTNYEVEQLFPVEEPELRRLYEQCIAFLADLGITAAEDTGYICRQSQKGNDYIIALLPYQIEGLSTEYKNLIVNRDSLQCSGKTGQHILPERTIVLSFRP